jgi:DNA-binding response OmpR family regulator
LALLGHICACMGVVASPVGSLRIVVIEDDEDLREALVEALREQGHAVIGLPAQDGIFRLSDSPPADAWVVDHRLPGRLGGDVVRAVREMGGERRPVLVGVSGDESAEREFAAAGADVFLRKPFTAADLGDAIVRAVERRRGGQ